jgi:hypothetical protein
MMIFESFGVLCILFFISWQLAVGSWQLGQRRYALRVTRSA